MTKKYVGENDSNSIKVLYDYCSRIDWHIFLKRIVDISYFINLKIFFLGSEGLCCYPEKKKEDRMIKELEKAGYKIEIAS